MSIETVLAELGKLYLELQVMRSAYEALKAENAALKQKQSSDPPVGS